MINRLFQAQLKSTNKALRASALKTIYHQLQVDLPYLMLYWEDILSAFKAPFHYQTNPIQGFTPWWNEVKIR
jgi:hypothetical protein